MEWSRNRGWGWYGQENLYAHNPMSVWFYFLQSSSSSRIDLVLFTSWVVLSRYLLSGSFLPIRQTSRWCGTKRCQSISLIYALSFLLDNQAAAERPTTGELQTRQIEILEVDDNQNKTNQTAYQEQSNKQEMRRELLTSHVRFVSAWIWIPQRRHRAQRAGMMILFPETSRPKPTNQPNPTHRLGDQIPGINDLIRLPCCVDRACWPGSSAILRTQTCTCPRPSILFSIERDDQDFFRLASSARLWTQPISYFPV